MQFSFFLVFFFFLLFVLSLRVSRYLVRIISYELVSTFVEIDNVLSLESLKRTPMFVLGKRRIKR